MIDGFVSQKTLDLLDPWAGRIRQSGLNGKILIHLSLATGILSGILAALQLYVPALILFLLNRFFDSVAKCIENTDAIESKRTAFDRIMFASFVFLFALGAVGTSLAAAFLLLSFLVVSAFDQHKNGFRPIIEKSEMAVFCAVCCAVPLTYAPLCIIVGFLCWVDGARLAFYSNRA